jgi:hypothetical protein
VNSEDLLPIVFTKDNTKIRATDATSVRLKPTQKRHLTYSRPWSNPRRLSRSLHSCGGEAIRTLECGSETTFILRAVVAAGKAFPGTDKGAVWCSGWCEFIFLSEVESTRIELICLYPIVMKIKRGSLTLVKSFTHALMSRARIYLQFRGSAASIPKVADNLCAGLTCIVSGR